MKNLPIRASSESFWSNGGRNKVAGDTWWATFGCCQKDCGRARNFIGRGSGMSDLVQDYFPFSYKRFTKLVAITENVAIISI